MPQARVGAIDLEYEDHGPADAEPILLVMGLGAQLVTWPVAFVERLVASGRRVVLFDNRDVGRSSRIAAASPGLGTLARALVGGPRVAAPYSLADMADDAAGLLDHLGIERTHVIGASMGGMIAQELAIRHPERVATVTSIMSTTGGRRVGRPSARLLPLFFRSRKRLGDPEEVAVDLGRGIGGPRFDEAACRALHHLQAERAGDADEAARGLARQTLAVLTARDRTADLARLTQPMLVVHGLLDRLVAPSGGLATARAVPGSRLVMYPDMAHDVPDTRVAELGQEIRDHLARAPIGVPAPV